MNLRPSVRPMFQQTFLSFSQKSFVSCYGNFVLLTLIWSGPHYVRCTYETFCKCENARSSRHKRVHVGYQKHVARIGRCRISHPRSARFGRSWTCFGAAAASQFPFSCDWFRFQVIELGVRTHRTQFVIFFFLRCHFIARVVGSLWQRKRERTHATIATKVNSNTFRTSIRIIQHACILRASCMHQTGSYFEIYRISTEMLWTRLWTGPIHEKIVTSLMILRKKLI